MARFVDPPCATLLHLIKRTPPWTINSWQTEDVRLQKIPLPEIEIDIDPVAIRLLSTAGRHYRLMKSTNLHEWNPAAPPLIGDDTELSFVLPAENTDLMYYRVEIRQ